MKQITHRQLRNDSGEVLRRVAAGETLLITNSGEPAALIGPPEGDMLAHLIARGQVREALAPAAALRSIKRKKAGLTTAAIIDDVRGHR